MSKGTLLVVGAAGDVGQGIVAAALGTGRRVVAAGRSTKNLESVAARHESENLACVSGDIGTEAGAAALWDAAQRCFDGIDDVVISVNSSNGPRPLLEWEPTDLVRLLSENVLTHFIAAKVFLPRMSAEGLLVGLGGGTADFIMAKMAHMSMVQAALRNLYRGLARERRTGPAIRELMIVSMVNGHSSREHAKPEWLTDEEIGRHVCAILDAPDRFPETILQLKSREQVAQPDPTASGR